MIEKPKDDPKFNLRQAGEGERGGKKKETLVPFTRKNSMELMEKEADEYIVMVSLSHRLVIHSFAAK